MTKHIALLGALLTAIACGGTTDSGNGPFDGDGNSGGSTSGGAGGKASAGSSSTAGSANNAGKSSGGTSSGGTSAGGKNSGGTSAGGTSAGGVTGGGVSSGGASGGVSTGGASGGGPSVDPRCPATTPSGSCMPDGLKCEYNPGTECLCASSNPGIGYCQPVDPTCTGPTPMPPPAEGGGGFSAKIAVPAHMRCTCASGKWECALGA